MKLSKQASYAYKVNTKLLGFSKDNKKATEYIKNSGSAQFDHLLTSGLKNTFGGHIGSLPQPSRCRFSLSL